MQRISSRTTFFNKRVFPLIWFGFLVILLIAPLLGQKPKGGFPFVFLIVPVCMGLFGYFLMKKLVFDLADEVFDDGDSLVVRFGSEKERIPLSEISNISYSHMTNPPRVTLTLRTPGRFGKEVTFSPPQSLIPFKKRQNRRRADRPHRCCASRLTHHIRGGDFQVPGSKFALIRD